jgi:hypothetical protein
MGERQQRIFLQKDGLIMGQILLRYLKYDEAGFTNLLISISLNAFLHTTIAPAAADDS